MSKATRCFLDKCRGPYEERDHDGYGLSLGQFREVLTEMLEYPVTDANIAEIFLEVDDNEDRKITWAEFEEAVNQRDPKSVQVPELEAVLKKYDKNGDGQLTVSEIRDAFQIAGVKGDPEKSLQCADKDDNGKVSVKEFISFWLSEVE